MCNKRGNGNYKRGTSKGIQIPIPGFQSVLAEVLPGEMVYIGQDNDRANAAIMLNMIRVLGIENRHRILFFNRAQGQYSFVRSLLSLCTGIDERELQHGEHLSKDAYEHLERTVTKVKDAKVSVVGIPNISVEQLIDEIYKLKREELPKLVLNDNLQLMTTRRQCKSRRQVYRYIVKKLRKMARELRIPILLTGPLAEHKRGIDALPLTAKDMPAEYLDEYFDKIVMICPKNVRDEAHILNIHAIKNPEGWHGSCQISYLPCCNELKAREP